MDSNQLSAVFIRCCTAANGQTYLAQVLQGSLRPESARICTLLLTYGSVQLCISMECGVVHSPIYVSTVLHRCITDIFLWVPVLLGKYIQDSSTSNLFISKGAQLEGWEASFRSGILLRVRSPACRLCALAMSDIVSLSQHTIKQEVQSRIKHQCG